MIFKSRRASSPLSAIRLEVQEDQNRAVLRSKPTILILKDVHRFLYSRAAVDQVLQMERSFSRGSLMPSH
jgi:hypothetical protein